MSDFPSTLAFPILGGALIGVSASLLLLSHGRVAGISGMFGGLLDRNVGDRGYRLWFLGGLFVAGLVAELVVPQAFGAPVTNDLFVIAVAGLLVGIGTRLGNGCTSGHGVCGLSRRSGRSLVATLTFIAAGIVTTALMRGQS